LNNQNKGNNKDTRDDNGKNIVLMFPGQGSQYVDMGSGFFEKNGKFKQYLKTASRFLGEDIQKIIRDIDSMGGLLDDTRFSQIAIFCVSSAINDYLTKDCLMDRSRIAATIGHSLGDYSALYSSGAFSFDDGARLVIFRGNLMAGYTQTGQQETPDQDKNEADSDESGKKMMMAAVLGADIETIRSFLKNYEDSVFIANYNDYTQTVISGYRKQVLKASEKIEEAGAKRVIPLKVSIASHCPLMKEASIRLKGYIEENFNDFSSIDRLNPGFFSSTRVGYVDSREIKQTLADQLISPIKWIDSIESLLAKGADVFIEVGPGKVLSGLVKRISIARGYKEITVLNTDSVLEIENLISFLKSNNLVTC
jgi:[acyl-carrier-protein] S-malonyltransferase